MQNRRDHICARSRIALEPPVDYPSLVAQAGNALGAAARFVASGFATVDRAEFDRRKGICLACEFYRENDDRCLKCGCYLAVKPWGVREHCPIDKW
jgi:hypothetical protein